MRYGPSPRQLAHCRGGETTRVFYTVNMVRFIVVGVTLTPCSSKISSRFENLSAAFPLLSVRALLSSHRRERHIFAFCSFVLSFAI